MSHLIYAQLIGFNLFKIIGGKTIDDYECRNFNYNYYLKQEIIFLNDKENFEKIYFPFWEAGNFSFIVQKK